MRVLAAAKELLRMKRHVWPGYEIKWSISHTNVHRQRERDQAVIGGKIRYEMINSMEGRKK